jgi:PLP dependent protein
MTETALDRLTDIRARIAQTAQDAARAPESVTLIAVSKTFGAEAIRPLLEGGQRDFGENRVQEAQGKWPELRAGFPDTRLHLIGPLQTNKARDAVRLFDTIHSLDRAGLARALADAIQKEGRAPSLFVQVNTGEEDQKSGVGPREAASFAASCRRDYGLPIDGLMCIPPEDDEPALHFALLGRLAGDLGLAQLSMGMSADYPTAIRLGATHVRIGSALFGARPESGSRPE